MWGILTLALWVGVPLAIVYAVRRFLRAYEQRTATLGRVEALERRLVLLEARLAAAEAPRGPAPHVG